MSNPFVRGWNHLKSSMNRSLDEAADPKVLMHQAEQDARERHEALRAQAAGVSGDRARLELAAQRLRARRETLDGEARTALAGADRARADGDVAAARRYEEAAAAVTQRLAVVDDELVETEALLAEAGNAAAEARRFVDEDAARLRDALARKDEVLLQAQQARIAEDEVEGSEKGGVPSFATVRAKIERKVASAAALTDLGSGEAAADAATMARIESGTVRDPAAAGRSRLEQIRASMRDDGA